MIRGIQEHRLVLQMNDAALTMTLGGDYETMEVDLELYGGEMILIHLQHPLQGSVLADACAGLVRPHRGTVDFLGKNWSMLPPDTENALRGRIGRVFAIGNWISHLTLLENILLPQLHHTRRTVKELCDEAGRLAARFGLPGIPAGFPDMCLQADLRIAACMRAFLGSPSLVILEDPTTEVSPEMLPPLINTIREVRGSGAAVIWMIVQDKLWHDRTIPATSRYRFAGPKLVGVAG